MIATKHFSRYIYMPFILLLAGIQFSNAQNNNTPGNEWQAIIKVAPTVLLEPEGGYQFGFEAPLSKRWGWQNEFAYLCYYWDVEGDMLEGLKFSGYALKTEARYYIFDSEHLEGLYLAPQFQYKYVFRSGTTDGGWDPWGRPAEPVFIKHYKEVAKANLKFGYQTISAGGLALDLYCGAGGRMAWVKSSPAGYENQFFTQEIPINVMLGFRLGWAF